ncbi:MAG: DUF3168 domain-containing protein, partial [Pseudomonadota bacterium]
MTYALSWALQQGIHAALSGDAALAALAPGGVHDAVPQSVAPGALYLTLGEEEVRPHGSADAPAAEHRFTVTVHSGAEGFAAAKAT